MEHRTNDWVRSKINSLVGPQETPLVTVKRENLHGSGMSHATTASPKPSFRIPWRVGSAVVGRGNAGWTTSKSAHPCPSKNCSQGPPAEKTGRGSLLNCPSCSSDNQTGQGTEANWRNSNSSIFRSDPFFEACCKRKCFQRNWQVINIYDWWSSIQPGE